MKRGNFLAWILDIQGNRELRIANRNKVIMLRVENISKTYEDGTQALKGVTFNVAPGEFVAVLGKSGSGKSTLIRCINRLVEPTEGSIFFGDDEIISQKVSNAWSSYEMSCSTIDYKKREMTGDGASSMAKIELHYFKNNCFLKFPDFGVSEVT